MARNRSLPTDGSPPLDRDTTERLLRGAVAPDDSPPGYADVARLVERLQAPPVPEELRGFERVAAAFAAPAPRGCRKAQLVTLLALTGVVTFGGLAAANALPPTAQRVTANVLHTIGVPVPSPAEPEEQPGTPVTGSDSVNDRGGDAVDEPVTTTR